MENLAAVAFKEEYGKALDEVVNYAEPKRHEVGTLSEIRRVMQELGGSTPVETDLFGESAQEYRNIAREQADTIANIQPSGWNSPKPPTEAAKKIRYNIEDIFSKLQKAVEQHNSDIGQVSTRSDGAVKATAGTAQRVGRQ